MLLDKFILELICNFLSNDDNNYYEQYTCTWNSCLDVLSTKTVFQLNKGTSTLKLLFVNRF